MRTAVALKGTDTGSNTQTTSTWARPYQQATTSTLNDPRGTPVTTGFDTVGQMSTHNPSTNNDTMTWDANGRMAKYSRRDTSNNGFNLNIVYDGFGRRLSTSNQLIMGGTNYGAPTVSYSEYDPEVEFLEAASSVGTRRRWLVHGPDLNGSYGGLNGTGGTDAVVNVGTSTTGMMSDAFGNTVASGTGTTVAWNTARSLGYGPQPGTTSQTLDNSHDVSTAMAWRGKYIDASGFYYLGARYYDPAAGSFLSADPLGHSVSMDLYTYCNGDPINGFDPDGRFGSKFANNYANGYSLTDSAKLAAADTASDIATSTGYAPLAYLVGLGDAVARTGVQLDSPQVTIPQSYQANYAFYGNSGNALIATIDPAVGLEGGLYEGFSGTGISPDNAGLELSANGRAYGFVKAYIGGVNTLGVGLGGAGLTRAAGWAGATKEPLLLKGPRTSLQMRNDPGLAYGNNLPVINEGEQWLRGTAANAGRVPGQIAMRLNGRSFASFDDFREVFWQEVANDPILSRQFEPNSMREMQAGRAPFAPPSEQVGGRIKYEIDHMTEIQDGGGVYDMNNLIIRTAVNHIGK